MDVKDVNRIFTHQVSEPQRHIVLNALGLLVDYRLSYALLPWQHRLGRGTHLDGHRHRQWRRGRGRPDHVLGRRQRDQQHHPGDSVVADPSQATAPPAAPRERSTLNASRRGSSRADRVPIRFPSVRHRRRANALRGRGTTRCARGRDGHGNPTWSFYYRTLIAEISKTHRVIVPDHVGCGLSDKPQDYTYTLEQHIRNLEALIAHLDLQHIYPGAARLGRRYRDGLRHAPPGTRYDRFVVFNTSAFYLPAVPLVLKLARSPDSGRVHPARPQRLRRTRTCAWRWPIGDRMTRPNPRGLSGPVRLLGTTASPSTASCRISRWPTTTPPEPPVDAIDAKLHLFRDHPMLIIWGARRLHLHRPILPRRMAQRFPMPMSTFSRTPGTTSSKMRTRRILPLVTTSWVDSRLAIARSSVYRQGISQSHRLPLPSTFVLTRSPYANHPTTSPPPSPTSPRASPTSRASSSRRAATRTGARRRSNSASSNSTRTCDSYAHGLSDFGIEMGDRVLLMIRPGIELIAVVFGLLGWAPCPCSSTRGWAAAPSPMHRRDSRTVSALIAHPDAHALRKPSRPCAVQERPAERRRRQAAALTRLLARHDAGAPARPRPGPLPHRADDDRRAKPPSPSPPAAPACRRASSTCTASSRRRSSCCGTTSACRRAKSTWPCSTSSPSSTRPWA